MNDINKKLVLANGLTATIGDGGSVSEVITKIAAEEGRYKTSAVEVTDEELKTHAWRLPKAREERLEDIRVTRNVKLEELDLEYQLADEGVHPDSLNKSQVAAKKVALRDLPPKAKTALDDLVNTDDIRAYTPDELK